MPRDYYSILGLEVDASNEEIAKSFRKMSIEFHPKRTDFEGKGPDLLHNSYMFREICEAYEVLSDSELRAQYDKFGG